MTKVYKGHSDAIRITAEEFRVTVKSIMSADRSKSVARARHAVCMVLSEYYNLSSVEIGRVIRRDHSTVLNSLTQASVLTCTEEDFHFAFRASLNRLIMRRLDPCSPLETLTDSCMGEGFDCITDA